jgi:hypothetical protein
MTQRQNPIVVTALVRPSRLLPRTELAALNGRGDPRYL